MVATNERGRADGPSASPLTTRPRSCLSRRVGYLFALQGAGIFSWLLCTDFSWLQRHTSTSTTTSTWRIQPFSSSSGWISTSKTVLDLAEDFDVEHHHQQQKQHQLQQPASRAGEYPSQLPQIIQNLQTRLTSLINSHGTDHADLNGVIPLPFLPWKNGTRSLADLCFPAEKRMMTTAIQRSPARKGFFLNKLMKVGGSTAAGINIRIAMSIAQRYADTNINKNSTTVKMKKKHAPLCRGRWDHSQAMKMQYGQRNLDHSFLWTVVREPTKRAVSQFFHFQVSKGNISATNHSEFQAYLSDVPVFYNYYLKTLRTKKRATAQPPPTSLTQQQQQQMFHKYRRMFLQQTQEEDSPVQTIQNILHDYDFVGITERMAESAVALMMLLNLTIPDVLFANAKTSGSYDDICTYIQPTNLTADMQAFLNGPKWQKRVYWDSVLYRAANRSLDLTIQRLNNNNQHQSNSNGIGAFDANLQEFLRIQALVHSQCIEGREVFPCISTTGKRNPKPDCLWHDSGCGHTCIKQVVQQLGL